MQNLYDDNSAAQGGGRRQVKCFQPTLCQTRGIKKHPTQAKAPENLHAGSDRNRLAGADHAFEVNLQPDHEQQQDQTQACNGLDG